MAQVTLTEEEKEMYEVVVPSVDDTQAVPDMFGESRNPLGMVQQKPVVLTEEEKLLYDIVPEPSYYEENLKRFIPDFLLKLGEDMEKRTEMVNQIEKDWDAGKINAFEYTTQVAGKGVAGRGIDIIGAGISGALDGISFLLPDMIEEPMLDSIKEGLDFVVNTKIGQEFSEAASKGVEEYRILKEKYPQHANTFESVVNIALLFSPVKARANSSPVKDFSRMSQNLERKGKTQIKTKAFNNIEDMLMPVKKTEAMANRSVEQGFGRRTVLKLTSFEQKMINEVRKVKDIKLTRSPQYNLEKINLHIERLAENLQTVLRKSDVKINPIDIKNRIMNDIDVLLKTNTFIASNPQLLTGIKKSSETALKIIRQNESFTHPPGWGARLKKKTPVGGFHTPSSLLTARKQFDVALTKNMPKAFDASAHNIFSESTKSIRQTINNIINEAAPSAFVKKKLASQHQLYVAKDMLAPKAADAISHGLGRLYQDLSRVIGLKMDLNRTMAVVYGSSAFAVSGPLFVGFAGGLAIGGAVTAGGLIATSPSMKIALGKLLKYTNTAIQKSTNKKMLTELRAHRVFIKDLLEQPPAEKNKENK
jgi:hypothetical protein